MTKIGRNAPCPCGSGLKYKRCCEIKDQMAGVDLSTVRQTLEEALSDVVYGSVLVGVWTAFHPEGKEPPDIEALEEHYYNVYGYDLDREALDDLVLPLPDEIFAGFSARDGQNAPVIDVTPEPEVAPPAVSQAELFPPEAGKDSPPSPE